MFFLSHSGFFLPWVFDNVFGDLGVSGLAIQEWLHRHKRVLGTRRVSGNSPVVQAASITTRDQPLHFFDTANFALIRCAAHLLQARDGSCLCDVF